MAQFRDIDLPVGIALRINGDLSIPSFNLSVGGTISEGGVLLSQKYLSIGAKASDSDKLDNLDSSSFMRSDANTSTTGNLMIAGTTKLSGTFYAGTTAPSATALRLNYDGPLYASQLYDGTTRVALSTRSIIAGTGLSGGGNLTADRTLAVVYAGTGVANSSARSDHDHNTTYLSITGGTISSDLAVNGNLTVMADRVINKQLSSPTTSYLQTIFLLHPIYDGVMIADYYCVGDFFAKRGSTTILNRKAIARVNTSSAYSTTKGGLESENEEYSLVTCTYGGVKYMAIRLPYSGAEFKYVYFDGLIKSDVNSLLMISYYNQNTSTVLNAEVNDSIAVYTSDSNKIIDSPSFFRKPVTIIQATDTSHAVRADRSIVAGVGLSGGGNLLENRTLSVVYSGNGTANSSARSDHDHNLAYLGVGGTAADSSKLGGTASGEFIRRNGSVGMTGVLLANSGIRTGSNHSHLKIGSFTTTRDVANQKIDIFFPANKAYYGTFDISVAGGYTWGNSTGIHTKRFVFHGTPAGVINYQSNKIIESNGNTHNHISISDITWDATNLRYRIQLSHLITANGNTFVVMAESFSSASSGVDGIESLQLGTIYTTDATVFPVQKQQLNQDVTTVAGSTLLHTGNTDLSKYVKNDIINQQVTGDFSIIGNSTLTIGASGTNSGSIVIRGSGANKIQVAGSNAAKLSGVTIYMNASGNAEFSGTVVANKIEVANRDMVSNLNAELLAGKAEAEFAKTESLFELGGYGVTKGLNVTQNSPTPNMSVIINAGIVYTDTYKRYVVAQKNESVTAASSTYNRLDTIFINGSKNAAGNPAGLIEGTIQYKAGVAAATPVEPTIPDGSIKLATILVRKSSGGGDVTIITSDITDAREWKPFGITDNEFHLRRIPLSVNSSLTSENASMVIDKPIKGTSWAKSIYIPLGQISSVWTHNLGLGTDYVVSLSPNIPNRHVYWSNKTSNSIAINMDDATDRDIMIDVIIIAV